MVYIVLEVDLDFSLFKENLKAMSLYFLILISETSRTFFAQKNTIIDNIASSRILLLPNQYISWPEKLV